MVLRTTIRPPVDALTKVSQYAQGSSARIIVSVFFDSWFWKTRILFIQDQHPIILCATGRRGESRASRGREASLDTRRIARARIEPPASSSLAAQFRHVYGDRFAL